MHSSARAINKSKSVMSEGRTAIVLLWCDVDHKWLIGLVCHPSHWEIFFRFAGLNYAKRPWWLSPMRAGASEQFNKFIALRRNWKFRTHIVPFHPPTLRWPWQHQQEPRILIDVHQDNVVHGYKKALLWNFPPDEASFPRLFTYVRFSGPAALLFAFGSRHLKIKKKWRRKNNFYFITEFFYCPLSVRLYKHGTCVLDNVWYVQYSECWRWELADIFNNNNKCSALWLRVAFTTEGGARYIYWLKK